MTCVIPHYNMRFYLNHHGLLMVLWILLIYIVVDDEYFLLWAALAYFIQGYSYLTLGIFVSPCLLLLSILCPRWSNIESSKYNLGMWIRAIIHVRHIVLTFLFLLLTRGSTYRGKQIRQGSRASLLHRHQYVTSKEFEHRTSDRRNNAKHFVWRGNISASSPLYLCYCIERTAESFYFAKFLNLL